MTQPASDAVGALLNAVLGSARSPGGCGCRDGHPDAPAVHLSFHADHHGAIGAGLGARTRRDLTIDFATAEMGAAAVQRASTDLAAILEVVNAHRREVLEVLARFQAGDLDGAGKLGRTIGLSEEQLQARGGAFPGLVVIIAIGLLLLTATPTSVTADPPLRPDAPHRIDDEQTAEDVANYLRRGQ